MAIHVRGPVRVHRNLGIRVPPEQLRAFDADGAVAEVDAQRRLPEERNPQRSGETEQIKILLRWFVFLWSVPGDAGLPRREAGADDRCDVGGYHLAIAIGIEPHPFVA